MALSFNRDLCVVNMTLIEAQEKGEVFDYTMAMKDDSGPAPWH